MWPFPRWLTLPAECLQTEGRTCAAVTAFQARFNALAHPRTPLAVDGVYGPATRRAVAAFQTSVLAVHADGFVGPLTAKALHIELLGDTT